jgi:hypothetical protein
MPSAVVGSLRVNLGLESAAFGKGLQQAGSKLSGFGAAFRKAILPMAGVGATAAVGLGRLVQTTVAAADRMREASQSFGVPVETLSRLTYAVGQSGVSSTRWASR